MGMKHAVALTRARSYQPEEVYPALRQAIDLAGPLNVERKRVLLKPNILRDAAPERAISTHPEFVRAAIRLCFEAGAKSVLVGDSPGVHRPGFDGRSSGIREVTEQEGARWVDFRGEKCHRRIEGALREESFHFAGILDEVDAVISLAKLKTHELMYYTGAMKNLYGLIPGYTKAALHVKYPGREDFGRMIVDLVRAVHPAYALMDGIVAMEGPGPGNGYPRSVGLVGASKSTLAMDIVFSRLLGYRAEEISSNRHAYGILDGISGPEDVEVAGLDPEEARPADFQKIGVSGQGAVTRFLNRFGFFHRLETRFRAKPVFHHEKCILCGECVAICASRALSFEGNGADRRVVVDYGSCIRCYCCHEVCPVEAIEIG
jgi:uncharacterized protein (DUF362 family)/Pyruvate/2-oxoacid:ferredoxin oxidoreductase delta subunit